MTDIDNLNLVTRNLFFDVVDNKVKGIRLTFSDKKFQGQYKKILWNGNLESIEFIVNIPESYSSPSIIATITILEGNIAVCSYSYKIEIMKKEMQFSSSEARMKGEMKNYMTAFISYSSKDKNEVIKRVQGIEATGISVFQDFKSIQPGEDWNSKLFDMIPKSDVFYLFWSNNAKNSDWVDKEINYAIQCQKSNPFMFPNIVPIVIEGPPIPAPPKVLEHLHFEDLNLYYLL